MFRNYLAAGLRNLARNRLHSAITILSLALGFAAVILASVIWRFEHSYDRFWPEHERIYAVSQWDLRRTGGTMMRDTAPALLAPVIAAGVPGLEQVTRRLGEEMRVESAQTEALEPGVSWVDLNFFEVFQPTSIAGDLKSALRPGNVVITRSTAEKYFGRPDAVGESLTLTRTVTPEVMPMRVAAVIEDLPANSHFKGDVLVAVRDRSRLDSLRQNAFTYVKTAPGVGEEALAGALAVLSERLAPAVQDQDLRQELRATPLRHFYMPPEKYRTSSANSMMQHGVELQIQLYMILGVLILTVAAINFVTLMTARGARRAVEVGVRKAAGARRLDLVAQFVGEGLLYTALSLVAGLALVEILLPLAAAATAKPLDFDYAGDLPFVGLLILSAVVVGVLAGLYPAIVLSSFRPAGVLKGGAAKAPGSARLRHVLIGLQFTPLLTLATGALFLSLQVQATFDNSLKILPPQTVLVREPCTPAVRSALETIPGAALVRCLEMNGTHTELGKAKAPILGVMAGSRVYQKGRLAPLFVTLTDRDALEFYGLAPVAGRLWSGPADERSVILNEEAAQRLGFRQPQMAVGQMIEARRREGAETMGWTVIGVVPNRGGLTSFEPALYFQILPNERQNPIAGMRLTADADVPAVLAAVDDAFEGLGAQQPPRRLIYRDELRDDLKDQRMFVQFMSGCVAIGVLIATFGLFGLAAFLAEQRTKEIGVRKALGASRGRLLQMLLFQFAMPVIIANLLAGPLVFGAFAFLQAEVEPGERMQLNPVIFLPIAIGSLAVAFIATFGHAWQVTGARPVKALRYE